MLSEYIPDSYSFDVSPYTGRYFYVKTAKWQNTMARYTIIQSIDSLPRNIFNVNTSLLNLVHSAALYRMKLILSVSLGGTIVHGGSLLVAAIPPATSEFYGGYNIVNTLLACPHGFLYASEATSIELAIPWYCNTDYAPTTTSGDYDFNYPAEAYASLVIMVINPLVIGGGSNELSITISAKFEELTLKVPAPTPAFINPYPPRIAFRSETIVGDVAKGISVMTKAGRKVTNAIGDIFDRVSNIASVFTGLHNPNITVLQEKVVTTGANYINTVDGQQYFEKLDPYVSVERITDDYIFGTDQDEMSLRHIAAKEQMIGTIVIQDTDQPGKVLWSRPISPFQTGGRAATNNLSLLYYLTRAWNGEFEIVLRNAGTAKQQFKLMVNRYYMPGGGIITGLPTMTSCMNALTQTLEFSQGGQEHVVLMPFLAPTEIIPCTMDSFTSSVMHGTYVIYVLQPLVAGDNAPLSAEVNVFIRSKSLNFYGYSTECPEVAVTNFVQLENTSKVEGALPVMRSESGVEFMNKPQVQEGGKVSESRESVSNRVHKIDSVRDLMRRMYKIGRLSKTNPHAVTLSTVLGADNPFLSFSKYVYTPLAMAASMFYGRQVGFKIRVVVRNPGNIKVARAYYLPPKPYAFSQVYQQCTARTTTGIDYGDFPLPFTELQTSYTTEMGNYVMEFVIPNVTLLKFISVNMSGQIYQPSDNLYIQDHGRLLLDIQADTNSEIDVYAGLTDESRLGFHCIAPWFAFADNGNPALQLESPYGDKDGNYLTVTNTAPSYYTRGFAI
jgi:hypothetical protein